MRTPNPHWRNLEPNPLQRTGRHPLPRNGREDRPTDGLTARMNESIQAGSEVGKYKTPWRKGRATIVVLFSTVLSERVVRCFSICGLQQLACWSQVILCVSVTGLRGSEVLSVRKSECSNGPAADGSQVYPSGGAIGWGGEVAPHRRPHPDGV